MSNNGTTTPIVNEQRFILATRDTGYRSTAAAVAELVDNSIQANATLIRVFIEQTGVGGERQVSVAVLDNGAGMNAQTLSIAMQFAGSSRFDDRSGLGRFGMGLPNSSVSQARRVDVHSWQRHGLVLHTYLDVDEIVGGTLRSVPKPKRSPLPSWVQKYARKSTGTLVQWTRCDRLDNRKAVTIAEKLHRPLGQRFRHYLWKGNRILVNDLPVHPFDPLYLRPEEQIAPAKPFGDVLTFEFRVPSNPRATSTVRVRFSELPVAEWQSQSIECKRELGVMKGAGVSIVRADREVDFGWYLLGGKRKENYDDWWRCEVSFEPELDELFGVTHSKQEINPSDLLRIELSPHLEAIAQTLNSRVRAAFALLRRPDDALASRATTRATQREPFMPPIHPLGSGGAKSRAPNSSDRNQLLRGVGYRIRSAPLSVPDAFVWDVAANGSITVTVNQNHAFSDQLFEQKTHRQLRHGLECLVLAFARAALALTSDNAEMLLAEFRTNFSNILAAYLGD